MKKLLSIISLIVVMSQSVNAQIGIGTSNPQASIDTNGTVRVTDLSSIAAESLDLTGVTASNILKRTDVGANLLMVNDSLVTAPVSRSIGANNLGAAPVDGSGDVMNWDLDIGVTGENELSTFINVHSYAVNKKISGIKGGTEGRHITLFFTQSNTITILENDTGSIAKNRFTTLETSGIIVAGQGFVDLVYDADAGPDGLGRWLVIKFNG